MMKTFNGLAFSCNDSYFFIFLSNSVNLIYYLYKTRKGHYFTAARGNKCTQFIRAETINLSTEKNYFDNLFSHFSSKFFSLYHSKLNIFDFRIVRRTKQDMYMFTWGLGLLFLM